MAYTEATIDDSTPVEERAYPRLMTCHKDTSTSTIGEYLMLPRDVKSVTIYCTAAHWVRVDKLSADPTAAKDLTTIKDNVIYVPAGSFVIAQQTEFNCVSYKTATGTGEIYIYPGYSATAAGSGLGTEDLAA